MQAPGVQPPPIRGASQSVTEDPMVGEALRAARLARRWTLEQVAERAGLSAAFLSRLERAQASSSLSNLIRLSGVLEIPLARLFAPGSRASARDGYVLRRGSDTGALAGGLYSYKPLAGGLPHHAIWAFELEYPPRQVDQAGVYSHDGEEVLYLLQGELEFRVGSASFVMRRGDCVQFDGRQPHGGRNRGKVPARMLMIVGGQVGSAASLPLCGGSAVEGPAVRRPVKARTRRKR
jgi:transcriptional regulator with XRE-family HTH domain